MTAKELCEKLSINYKKELDEYVQKGIKMYSELGLYALDKQRLTRLNDEYRFIRKHLDEVLLAADDVSADNAAIIYVYTLIAIIKDDANTSILESPDMGCRKTDFLPLFSLLYFLEDMIGEWGKRGIPKEIISATLKDFDTKLEDYNKLFGRPGIRTYVPWYLYFIKCTILRIGRLQYNIKKMSVAVRAYTKGDDVKILMDARDMHKKGMAFGAVGQDNEDEKYYAEITESDGCVTGYAANEYGECVPEPITLVGYERLVGIGDYVLDLHIPSAESFTPEEVSESLRLATEFYKKYYPEYDFKAFLCLSWLLEGRLEEIIGKQSNITKFQSLFTLFPTSCKRSGVYPCLFNTREAKDACELPEDTSMQRAVKKWLASGRYYYDKGGIIPFGAFQSR